MHAQRAVRLGVGALRHARLVPVADVLAAHELRLPERADGLHDLDRLVAQGVRVGRDRRLHGQQADHLQEMVLHDVAQAADAVVERAATLDAERLRHRHLHALHEVTVPDGLEQRVREPEDHQVLHGLLAEEVVDPVDRVLGEMPVEQGVELHARWRGRGRTASRARSARRAGHRFPRAPRSRRRRARAGWRGSRRGASPRPGRCAEPGRWRDRRNHPGRSAGARTGA